MSDIQIRVASTNSERLDAYRLRYDVFTREDNDERYADHKQQIFLDQCDGPATRLIVAITSDQDVHETVGTLRLVLRKEQHFLKDETYRFDLLGNLLGITESQVLQTSGLVDRGVVRADYRGSGLFTKIMNVADEVFLSEGINIVIGAVKAENTHSRTILGRWGFSKYAISQKSNGYDFDLIYRKIAGS